MVDPKLDQSLQMEATFFGVEFAALSSFFPGGNHR